MLLRGALLTLPLLTFACVENSIDLETDSDDAAGSDSASTTTSAGGPTTVTTTTVGDTTEGPVDETEIMPGEPLVMLLAIDTSLAPGIPFQGIVVATLDGDDIDLTLQWLSLDLGGTTTPREPVGEVYSYPGVPVDPEGGFIWDTGNILLPGAANPLTGGDVDLSAELRVVPEGDPYCGRVGGMITSPIQAPLDGSTHAMTEIFDIGDLPLAFLMSCPP